MSTCSDNTELERIINYVQNIGVEKSVCKRHVSWNENNCNEQVSKQHSTYPCYNLKVYDDTPKETVLSHTSSSSSSMTIVETPKWKEPEHPKQRNKKRREISEIPSLASSSRLRANQEAKQKNTIKPSEITNDAIISSPIDQGWCDLPNPAENHTTIIFDQNNINNNSNNRKNQIIKDKRKGKRKE